MQALLQIAFQQRQQGALKATTRAIISRKVLEGAGKKKIIRLF